MIMKILLVDDSEDFRILCKYELEDAGYEVILSGTASGALESLRKEGPDLVILDIKLPDMDGLELLGLMKESRSDVPVIMHTAYDYMYDLACDMSDAYVVKSADFSELKQRIAQLTKDSGASRKGRSAYADTDRVFETISIRIRESHLKRLRKLGGTDVESLSGLIDDALSAYLKRMGY
jgi:DNA-binding response OmpR family regulator